MKRVFIANRGEIAVRIVDACRELDLESVVGASAADMDGMAAREADRAVCIGPPPASESYLRPDVVVQAALGTGCDAIHPGYGFLSESPRLARLARENGLMFVGPPTEAIELAGDKLAARREAAEAGAPVLPGGEVSSTAEARALAAEIGYPLLVKAAGGGGGRGIKRVHDEDELEALLTLARSNRGLDRRQPIDLAKITGEVTRSRQPEAELRTIRVGTSLKAAWALGDENLAQRLVANLVDNALRHNVPSGWVEISATARHGRAVLSVANTGPVIEQALVSGLFEPFRRAGPDRTGSQDGGIGLGLSIVHAIVTAHDAQVRARARPGGGLEVQVRFPPAPPVRAAAPDPGW